MTHPSSETIRWDIDIPLATNPVMWGAMIKATLGAALGVSALVGLLLAVQGDWRLVLPVAGLLLACGAGLLLLAGVVMVLVFGNRLGARFVVDAEGVRYAQRDRRAHAANRGALVLGLLLGRPAAAGSGLLATLDEQKALRWQGAFRAEAHPARHTIALRNRWRTLLWLYCTPANFEAVQALVNHQLAQHGTANRAVGASPLRGHLLRTALVVAACLPLLLLAPVYGHGLLLPLVLMCFALATVWLLRPLAWVVLVAAVLLVGRMLMGAVEPRPSSFRAGITYWRFELLSGDDWALTALAALGLVYLVWLAVQTLRARTLPALEGDLLDGSGR